MVDTGRILVCKAIEGINQGPIPIVPQFQGAWALDLFGVTSQEAISDASLNANVQMTMAKDLRLDGFEGMWDWLCMVEAMGGEQTINPRLATPTMGHLAGSEDLIEIDSRTIKNHERSSSNLRSLETCSRSERYVYGTIPAPFTLAGELFGLEGLLIKLALEPDYAEELIMSCVSALKEYRSCYGEVCDGVMVCEASGSGDIISPSDIRSFVIPPLKQLLKKWSDDYDDLLHLSGDILGTMTDLDDAGHSLLSSDDVDINVVLRNSSRALLYGEETVSNFNDTAESRGKSLIGTLEDPNDCSRLLIGFSCGIGERLNK